MKLVREYIFEKFEKESDPIKDLGIGFEREIKEWCEDEYSGIYNRESALIFSCFDGKAEYVEFLIDAGVDPTTNNNSPLKWATRTNNINVVKILLEKGGISKEALEYVINFLDSLRFLEKNNASIKYLKKYYNKKFNEKIDEKFEEKSDPISDMGIGMMRIIKDFCEKTESYYAENKKHWLWICCRENKPEYVKYLIKKGWDINVDSGFPLIAAATTDNLELINYLIDNRARVNLHNTSSITYILKKEHEESYDLINKRMAELNFSGFKNNESINEKFEEESDPIHDMGIGDPLYVAGGRLQKFAKEHDYEFEMKKTRGNKETPSLYVPIKPRFEGRTGFQGGGAIYITKFKYTITYLPEWQPTPYSLRKVWMGYVYVPTDDELSKRPEKTYYGYEEYDNWKISLLKKEMKKGTLKEKALKQQLIGRYGDLTKLLKRIEGSIKKESKK